MVSQCGAVSTPSDRFTARYGAGAQITNPDLVRRVLTEKNGLLLGDLVAPLSRSGRHAEVATIYETAVAAKRDSEGESWLTHHYRKNAASAYEQAQRFQDAERVLSEDLEAQQAAGITALQDYSAHHLARLFARTQRKNAGQELMAVAHRYLRGSLSPMLVFYAAQEKWSDALSLVWDDKNPSLTPELNLLAREGYQLSTEQVRRLLHSPGTSTLKVHGEIEEQFCRALLVERTYQEMQSQRGSKPTTLQFWKQWARMRCLPDLIGD